MNFATTAIVVPLALVPAGPVALQTSLMMPLSRMIGATFATALRLTRPLADQGDDFAQYNLGIMYARGQGVAQSLAEAFKWFRLSANQGNASAQYNLGVMFAEGNGVPLPLPQK